MALNFFNYFKKRIHFALALLLICYGIALFILLLKSPYLGMDFKSQNDKISITTVYSDGPAAKYAGIVGKEVIAIDGWKLDPFDLEKDYDNIVEANSYQHFLNAQRFLCKDIRIGKPVEILLADGSVIQLIPAPFPLLHAIYITGINYFVVLFALFLGLVVFLKRSEQREVQLLLIIALAFGLYRFSSAIMDGRDLAMNFQALRLIMTINGLSGAFITVIILHFCLTFPKRIEIPGRYLLFLYALPLPIYFIHTLRTFYLALPLFEMAVLISALLLLIKSYLSTQSSLEKVQLRLLLFALGAVPIFVVVSYFVPVLLFGQNIVSDWIFVPLIILSLLAITFAIMKYRMMEIDTLFDNTLIYSVTLGLLAAMDFAIISILTDLKILNLSFSQPMSFVIAVWLIIFAYVPVRNKVRNLFRKLLKRELYDVNEVTARLNKNLLAANSVSEALTLALKTLEEAIHPKGGWAFLWNQTEDQASVGNIKESLPLTEKEIRAFSSSTPLSNLDLRGNQVPKEFMAGAVVPVIGATGPLGYLLLQEKHSGRLYDKGDLLLLDTVAGHTGLAIEAISQREGRQKAETEIKILQEQLYQIQKMDSIGKFAGGIAHDFKNLLVAAQGYTELAMEEVPEGSPLHTYLTEIQQTANRGIGLTRKLLLFSQGQSLDLNPLNCNTAIADMLKMLRFLVGKRHSIVTQLAENLWTIQGDNHHLSQVLMNLVINARDAMPGGGKILIRTHNAVIDEIYCKARVEAYPGKFICMSVQDTGIGMDEAVLAKIFEPFFTTKEAGKGTGLGLAVVYGIVKQHKGWIDVQSIPGAGTTVQIYLPALVSS